MHKNMFLRLLLILAIAGVLSAGCATTKNTGVAVKAGATEAGQQVADKAEEAVAKVEDASITSAIKMKFANDPLVSASNINVDTTDGNVTLNGTVANQAELDRAMTLGRSVNGVNRVHSKLTVSPGRK